MKRWFRNLDLKRQWRWFKQRRKQGFDERVTWNLDGALAKWMAPKIKLFKQLNVGYPHELTWEQWNAILDELIWAFEWRSSKNYWDEDLDELKSTRYRTAMEMFGKFIWHMWW